MQRDLEGRIAIITGANQGLGLEITKKYVLAGASVMMCARNEKRLLDAYKEVNQLVKTNQRVLYKAIDVSVDSEVSTLVDETLTQLGGCHILVNNAGIYGPKGVIESTEWSEWVKIIEINVYGSILLCRALLPHFKKQGYGKIIQLSGGGATKPLPRLCAYAVSKAAIVKFIETLTEEVREYGIDANSIAPGALNTGMLDEVLAAGPLKVGQAFYDLSVQQKKTGGTSLLSGAELAVFLGSAASDGITGKLISALWDNWKQWPKYVKELSSSDAYTLRRVIGKDRDFEWADK